MDVSEILMAATRADNNQMAIANFGLYRAHVEAGFTEKQALSLLKSMVRTMLQTQLLLASGVVQDEQPDGN
jgi:hypothetical protein